MGMGDKPKAFSPDYKPIRCDVTGKMFAPNCVVSCPEPHVIAKYGVGGKCNVSVWICRKCRYVKTYKWHGGVSCGYTTI